MTAKVKANFTASVKELVKQGIKKNIFVALQLNKCNNFKTTKFLIFPLQTVLVCRLSSRPTTNHTPTWTRPLRCYYAAPSVVSLHIHSLYITHTQKSETQQLISAGTLWISYLQDIPAHRLAHCRSSWNPTQNKGKRVPCVKLWPQASLPPPEHSLGKYRAFNFKLAENNYRQWSHCTLQTLCPEVFPVRLCGFRTPCFSVCVPGVFVQRPAVLLLQTQFPQGGKKLLQWRWSRKSYEGAAEYMHSHKVELQLEGIFWMDF